MSDNGNNKERRPDAVWTKDKVIKLKQQDRLIQEQFVRDTGQVVFATLRRYLNCEEDVRDCFQETFCNAFHKISSYRGESAIKTWLVSIARNCALSKLRSKKSKLADTGDSNNALVYDEFGFLIFPTDLLAPDAESLLESREVQRVVHDAIAGLSDTHKTVITMKDIDDMSYTEIAEALNIGLSATKVRIHRARLELRLKLMRIFKGKIHV